MPNIAKKGPGVRPLKALTDQQRRFVEEYVVDMNASAAAVRAGYSRKSSGLYSTMMSNRAVVAAVEDALARKRARSEVDADRVLAELARVAFANVLDFVGEDGRIDLAAIGRDAGAAVSRVSVEYFEGAPPRSAAPAPAPPRSAPLRQAQESRPPHEGEGGLSCPVLEPTPLCAPSTGSGESPSPGGEGRAGVAPPRSAAQSRPPHEGEGCGPPEPRVRRVTLTLADKTAALKQIARNLGFDREAGEGRADEAQERELVCVVQTGVPRWDDASGVRYLGREGGVNQLIRELRGLGWRSPGEVEKLVERAGTAALPGPASEG